jgi:F0F1-type ATP synthase membrane subunit c/vacuolar-type H+-ATPase subunit K
MDADAHQEWGEDPGWRPTLRVLIPFAPLVFRANRRRDPITILRMMYLTFVLAIILYGFVLTQILSFRSTHNGLAWAIGIGAVALANLVVERRVERPLSCECEAALATTYRSRTFVRIAFAESTALLGFVAAFTINGSWIYFFSALCSAPAFWRAAPTKAALTRDQDELASRGSAHSLVEAIRRRPAKPT